MTGGNRINDDEVLYVTLILMFGEPPTAPRSYCSDHFQQQLRFSQDLKNYALKVKDFMAELGHNPHVGLFTSYIHWAKEQWDAKQHEPQGAEVSHGKARTELYHLPVSSRPTVR